MKCKKCGSKNVSLSRVSEVKTKKKSGWKYWLTGMFLWDALATFFLGIFFLIPRILFRKKPKVETKIHTEAVCNDCGKHWRVK